MKVKISIIIPVYNVEKYLQECLDSILNQTFQDFEIICVDDGSTDGSLDILKEYEQKDKRFKIISQNNKGVSTARNVGIQHAQGEYIMFVDSDDWLHVNTFEILYNTAKNRASELLLFSFYRYTQNSIIDDGRLLYFSNILKENNTTFEKSYSNLFDCPMGVCGKFYLTSFLKNNHILYPVNINCGEDRVFFINACINAKSISVINSPLYYYRMYTENSLTKNSSDTLPHIYKADKIIKELLYTSNLDNKDDIYMTFLENSVSSFLYFWNSLYNSLSKTKNYKYLKSFKKEFSKNKTSDSYRQLSQAIYNHQTLFLRKLLEPIIELEFRRNKIILYLFEKQAICFSTNKIIDFILNFRYLKHLWKLRIKSRFKKIKVGFWVTEIEKWSSSVSLYEELLKNPHFEPFVMLANFKKSETGISPQEHMLKGATYFENNKIAFIPVYNTKQGKHLELKDFKPDIVFYQQPWQIHDNQNLINTSKHALIAYVPYCYYSLNSYLNYLLGFHGKLWKYFVESNLHKEEYAQKFNAKNCVAIGSCKLDSYKNIKADKINEIWKSKNKKRIIYAPHHSFSKSIHHVGTFKENAQFILNIAKNSQNCEWIFRPHPRLKNEVLANKIMTVSEIENYFTQWEKIGSIYNGGDYYEMFAGSDCLITDCISFLSEYLPTGKPVIHLRKENQKESFNTLLQTITDSYYKVYDNETLTKVFEEVVVNGNDYLKNKRIENIKLLMIDENKTTGEKIKEYLEKELWLRR